MRETGIDIQLHDVEEVRVTTEQTEIAGWTELTCIVKGRIQIITLFGVNGEIPVMKLGDQDES